MGRKNRRLATDAAGSLKVIVRKALGADAVDLLHDPSRPAWPPVKKTAR